MGKDDEAGSFIVDAEDRAGAADRDVDARFGRRGIRVDFQKCDHVSCSGRTEAVDTPFQSRQGIEGSDDARIGVKFHLVLLERRQGAFAQFPAVLRYLRGLPRFVIIPGWRRRSIPVQKLVFKRAQVKIDPWRKRMHAPFVTIEPDGFTGGKIETFDGAFASKQGLAAEITEGVEIQMTDEGAQFVRARTQVGGDVVMLYRERVVEVTVGTASDWLAVEKQLIGVVGGHAQHRRLGYGVLRHMESMTIPDEFLRKAFGLEVGRANQVHVRVAVSEGGCSGHLTEPTTPQAARQR